MNWYEYRRIDNYGSYPDPVGPYKKPDSNILCPAYTKVTAISSGVVTGDERPAWANGQPSVTIKLDTPINDIATHEAYNYLGTSSVSVGQKISIGDEIGVCSDQIGITLAFALTADDIYGGATFMQYNGDERLDPVPVLDAAKNGTSVSGSSTSGNNTSNNILVNIGEWIATNIFRTNADIVSATSAVSTTPYLVIGIATLAIPAIVATLLLVSFVSL